MSEEVKEYGSKETDDIYRALRSFYLKCCDGPLTVIKAGDRVRLTKTSAKELFASNKVDPVNAPAVGAYQALRPFRIATPQGSYWDVLRTDELEMTWDEARPLIIREEVKPITERTEVKTI